MAIQPVPAMTPVPRFPALSERAAGTYNASAYNFGTHMSATFNGELLAVAESAKANAQEAIGAVSSVSTSATNAANSAINAANSATAAASNANAAAASAGGQLWVSGTTYEVGALVFSSVTGRNYRRLIAGAGTTDPSVDSANWRSVLLDAFTGMPRIRPTLLLDFANSQSVDPRITITRATTAMRRNKLGILETVAANVPRIDYDPVTLACIGFLHEAEARTNLLLNSLLDGASLATQSVTVTAVAYTLSFYGTGTITLSGTHTATVVGAGAYPARQALTFTPTAGILTLTVTGTVQFSNLEAGAFPSSYIPTGATAVTRAADFAWMDGLNFSSWYRQGEGTLFIQRTDAELIATGVNEFTIADAAGTNLIQFRQGAVIAGGDMVVRFGGTSVADTASFSVTPGTSYRAALAFKKDDFVLVANGSVVDTDTSGDLGAMTRVLFPTSGISTYQCVAYYPKRLSNAELQALTAP